MKERRQDVASPFRSWQQFGPEKLSQIAGQGSVTNYYTYL